MEKLHCIRLQGLDVSRFVASFSSMEPSSKMPITTAILPCMMPHILGTWKLSSFFCNTLQQMSRTPPHFDAVRAICKGRPRCTELHAGGVWRFAGSCSNTVPSSRMPMTTATLPCMTRHLLRAWTPSAFFCNTPRQMGPMPPPFDAAHVICEGRPRCTELQRGGVSKLAVSCSCTEPSSTMRITMAKLLCKLPKKAIGP
ncbi:hypothetical protein PENSPDRAFT_619429 [Peniophora sp. CONT]|nr:hypothetical protein PENSPDRAFT_619429 [Peniophora sp. CONT]